MKAVQIDDFGGKEAVKVRDVEVPKPGENEVLVSVRYAGLNPVDVGISKGYMKSAVEKKLPATLGGDFSGVVEKVGEGIEDLTEGDRVMGYGFILSGDTGSFAEKLVVKRDDLTRVPEGMDMRTAGAVPLVGMSAWDVIHNKMKLKEGETILVHGASGGIGSIAVQMAGKMGARVLATATPSGVDFVRSIGADKVIGYEKEDFETVYSNVDAVFDTVGGDVFRRSVKVVKDGGVVVTMLPPSDMPNRISGVRTIGEATQKAVNRENLSRMAGEIKEKEIKVNIDRTFALSEVAKAFEYYEKEHPKGKILIDVK